MRRTNCKIWWHPFLLRDPFDAEYLELSSMTLNQEWLNSIWMRSLHIRSTATFQVMKHNTIDRSRWTYKFHIHLLLHQIIFILSRVCLSLVMQKRKAYNDTWCLGKSLFFCERSPVECTRISYSLVLQSHPRGQRKQYEAWKRRQNAMQRKEKKRKERKGSSYMRDLQWMKSLLELLQPKSHTKYVHQTHWVLDRSMTISFKTLESSLSKRNTCSKTVWPVFLYVCVIMAAWLCFYDYILMSILDCRDCSTLT